MLLSHTDSTKQHELSLLDENQPAFVNANLKHIQLSVAYLLAMLFYNSVKIQFYMIYFIMKILIVQNANKTFEF